MTESTLGLIFYSWILTFIWQWISTPFLIYFFRKKLFDGGWAWGRIISWLSIGLLTWFLSHLGLPLNTRKSVWLFTVLGLTFSSWFYVKKKKVLKEFIKSHLLVIGVEETIFFLGFFIQSFIRSFNPAILDLEKFMDAGLMMSYLRSPTLPLEDMWLAGEKVNYYTFGQFLGAQATHFWGIDLAYSYNVLLGLLFGLLLLESMSLVVNILASVLGKSISPRAKTWTLIRSGLVGAFLVGVGSNSHPIWFFLKNRTMEGYWYPDATRFIENTIHEFPTYSFVVSDLHAHVWSMPIVLLMVLVIWFWMNSILSVKKFVLRTLSQEKYIHWSLVAGGLLGVLAMTSTWDAMIYSLFLAMAGLLILVKKTKLFLPLLSSAVVTVVCMLVVSSAWWLNFDSISEGVRWVELRSPVRELVILWGGHIFFTSIAALFAFLQIGKTEDERFKYTYLFIVSMILTAWLLILLPEFFYMKDIYPNHPRANTMFKLTFQSYILMGLGIGWLYGFLQKKIFSRDIRMVFTACILVFMMGVAVYPYNAFKNYYSNFEKPVGLNGLAWLEDQHPDDFLGIQWLQGNAVYGDHVLEAVGESYTTFARVSTFSGVPTVLGWRVHEWLWRGGFDIPSKRTDEVKIIYENPLSNEAREILRRYDVQYIFIGDMEREIYSIKDEQSMRALGNVVFQSGNTTILRVKIL